METNCSEVVVETDVGVGECVLGEDCPVAPLRATDYTAYRDAHRNVVPDWLVAPE